MNKDTKQIQSVSTEEKINQCFKEMKAEYDLETASLQREEQKIKEKEEREFINLVYETGIPVYEGDKLTILDKKTNKIVELSANICLVNKN